jgi:hypothetical protein
MNEKRLFCNFFEMFEPNEIVIEKIVIQRTKGFCVYDLSITIEKSNYKQITINNITTNKHLCNILMQLVDYLQID